MSSAETVESELWVERLPDLPAGEEIWADLAREAGNPFSTWEWAAAWWRHFGEGREQRIFGFRERGGELVGVLPTYVQSRRPLRVLRVIGHGPADQLEPACPPARRAAVGAALRGLVAASKREILLLERLPAEAGWPDLVGGLPTRSEPSPTIRFESDDWEQYLASKSSNYRSQVRRWERRLGKDHELRFRLADDPARLDQDMTTFLDLHDARWEREGTTAFAGRLRRFHHDFAALALAAGWLRLHFLELDGVPRAAIYCFRLGGADWYYQAGRDPAYERQRVGNVLLTHAMRDAVNAGQTEFKLLLGEHAYKNRLMTAAPPVQSVALTGGTATAAALRAAVAAKRGGESVRRRLRGARR